MCLAPSGCQGVRLCEADGTFAACVCDDGGSSGGTSGASGSGGVATGGVSGGGASGASGSGGGAGTGGGAGADAGADAGSEAGSDAATDGGQLCTPNAKYCDGASVKQCSTDGSSASLVQTCTPTQFCDAVSTSCKAQLCTPSTRTCSGTTLLECNAQGSAETTVVDCATTGKKCLDGACDPNVADLVAYWRFDDATGTAARDSSGAGLHGTLNGGSWVSGKVGGALSFDGDDFVDVGDVLNGLTLPFTILAWVKPDATGGALASSDENGLTNYQGFNWYFLTNESRPGFHYGDATCSCTTGRRTRAGKTALPLTQWSHVAAIVTSNNISLFEDGVGDDSAMNGTATTMVHTADPLRIGVARGLFFKGAIDELRIYSRALTIPEIQALMTP